jgi:hypothetical protein
MVEQAHWIDRFGVRLPLLDEPDQIQKEQRADQGGNQGADNSSRSYAEETEHPPADEGAKNTDNQVPNQSEPRTFHDLSGQETGKAPNYEKEDQALRGHRITSCVWTAKPFGRRTAACT